MAIILTATSVKQNLFLFFYLFFCLFFLFYFFFHLIKSFFLNYLTFSFVSGSNETKYQFKIPIKGCGTSRVNIDIEEESIDIKGFENIIVIQNNPAYQAINDSVRMIVCRYTATIMDGPSARQSMDKRILFKPFTVDMLDVINVSVFNNENEKNKTTNFFLFNHQCHLYINSFTGSNVWT